MTSPAATVTCERLIVDGNNLAVRAWHAAQRSAMTTTDGFPTGALFLTIQGLAGHVAHFRPERLVVCFDEGPSTFRRHLYPAYKANRTGSFDADAAEGRSALLREVMAFCSAAGVPYISMSGWEADDLIAAYAYGSDAPTVIVSDDKDLRQLVTDTTVTADTSTAVGKRRVWDVAAVTAHYGVPPRALASLLALTGDTSDGVPGVPGIGPKRAAKLLNQHMLDFNLVAEALGEVYSTSSLLRSWRLVSLDHAVALFLVRNGHSEDFPEVPEFHPVSPHNDPRWPALEEFLYDRELQSVIARYSSGTMWS